MTDIYDRAQKRDLQNLKDAQDAWKASQTPEPPQQVIGGTVLCIDCDEPVQPERLKAKPNAARCIFCQGQYEKEHRHG